MGIETKSLWKKTSRTHRKATTRNLVIIITQKTGKRKAKIVITLGAKNHLTLTFKIFVIKSSTSTRAFLTDFIVIKTNTTAKIQVNLEVVWKISCLTKFLEINRKKEHKNCQIS